MSKPIKAPENLYIPESELMYGRRHIRKLLSRAEGYDQLQYRYWRMYLEQMALSAFEWENVPAGIDTRAIEYILLHFGCGAIFKEFGGYLFAQSAPANRWNMYYNPNEVLLTSPNGDIWTRHAQAWSKETRGEYELMLPDCAICFDNIGREPFMLYIDWYAQRLARYDRTADMNIDAQKTPWIIAGSEEAKKTRKDLVKQLDSNDQYWELNNAPGGGVDNLPFVLTTGAPYVADKIFESKQKILNEALTLIGVDNTNNEKRERQIKDEVLANNEQISLLRNARLKCRKEFAKRANELFGLEIGVKWSVPHLMEAPSTDGNAFNIGEEE